MPDMIFGIPFDEELFLDMWNEAPDPYYTAMIQSGHRSSGPLRPRCCKTGSYKCCRAVSYTHLDVYKRQGVHQGANGKGQLLQCCTFRTYWQIPTHPRIYINII